MSHFNEHNLEMTIRELLERQGYEYQSGETIHKKLSEVMLLDDLYMFSTEGFRELLGTREDVNTELSKYMGGRAE